MPEPEADAALVGDLLARDRRDGSPALHAAAPDRTISYRDLCTTAYKVGNVLSHHGVRAGDRVAVEPLPLPEPVLTFLGAAMLGAVTEFRAEPGTDARAAVVHADREDEFDLPPGSRLVAFGGAPERATTTHWEGEVWSENPAFPPTDVEPTDPVLAAEDDGGVEQFSHRDLLVVARDAVERLELDGGSNLALHASLADPYAVAAGVLAPLLVGGCICLPDEDGNEPSATAAITDGRPVADDRPTSERRVLQLDSLRP
ncbi:AMP-binding protein [Halorarum halophilum]|uniref:AMP-binding protein n=1 Tax=Halorarum halophilum TaxID=2743090 RepID=A0A7D5L2N4_9EURY|nr:AMP-binding protein [Halobaculum halophilum]QLG27003.1 AMP-binding protein [Halobaculum halophilum]